MMISVPLEEPQISHHICYNTCIRFLTVNAVFSDHTFFFERKDWRVNIPSGVLKQAAGNHGPSRHGRGRRRPRGKPALARSCKHHERVFGFVPSGFWPLAVCLSVSWKAWPFIHKFFYYPNWYIYPSAVKVFFFYKSCLQRHYIYVCVYIDVCMYIYLLYVGRGQPPKGSSLPHDVFHLQAGLLSTVEVSRSYQDTVTSKSSKKSVSCYWPFETKSRSCFEPSLVTTSYD